MTPPAITTNDTIRRLADGSIDYRFYYAEAHRLRFEERRAALRWLWALIRKVASFRIDFTLGRGLGQAGMTARASAHLRGERQRASLQIPSEPLNAPVFGVQYRGRSRSTATPAARLRPV